MFAQKKSSGLYQTGGKFYRYKLLDAVLLVELINTAAGVNELLLAGVERMALCADFNGEILFGAAGGISCAASALDDGGLIVRMDTLLHNVTLLIHMLL